MLAMCQPRDHRLAVPGAGARAWPPVRRRPAGAGGGLDAQSSTSTPVRPRCTAPMLARGPRASRRAVRGGRRRCRPPSTSRTRAPAAASRIQCCRVTAAIVAGGRAHAESAACPSPRLPASTSPAGPRAASRSPWRSARAMAPACACAARPPRVVRELRGLAAHAGAVAGRLRLPLACRASWSKRWLAARVAGADGVLCGALARADPRHLRRLLRRAAGGRKFAHRAWICRVRRPR